MNSGEKFELRLADNIWATLTFLPDGRVVLEHDLIEYQVKLCPGPALYNGNGQMVNVALGDIGGGHTGVLLGWADGRVRRKLALDVDTSEFVEVRDPKNRVRLVVKSAAVPGSIGNQPLTVTAGIVFGLRWIAP